MKAIEKLKEYLSQHGQPHRAGLTIYESDCTEILAEVEKLRLALVRADRYARAAEDGAAEWKARCERAEARCSPQDRKGTAVAGEE